MMNAPTPKAPAVHPETMFYVIRYREVLALRILLRVCRLHSLTTAGSITASSFDL